MRSCDLAEQHTWDGLHDLFGHYLPLIVRQLCTSLLPSKVGPRLWLLSAPQHSPVLRFGQKLLQNAALLGVPSGGGCSGHEQHSQRCKGQHLFPWHVWKTTRKFSDIYQKGQCLKTQILRRYLLGVWWKREMSAATAGCDSWMLVLHLQLFYTTRPILARWAQINSR